MRLLQNVAFSLLRKGKSIITPASADQIHLEKWIRGEKTNQEKSFLSYETLNVNKNDKGIVTLKLNRPNKLNAMNMKMFEEVQQFFQTVEIDKSIRVVIISAEGKAFSSGMDLNVFDSMQNLALKEKCEGRKREELLYIINQFQRIISLPELCRVPVIAAINGICFGGAVDFITACDLRYCTKSSEFSIKEIDLGIVADIGTLQRLPSIVGEQRAKELSFTGRHFSGEEAKSFGLVLDCHQDIDILHKQVEEIALKIASQSPLTIRGIKKSILYKRDHTVEDSLHQVRHWNSAMLYSQDLIESFTAKMTKTNPLFRD